MVVVAAACCLLLHQAGVTLLGCSNIIVVVCGRRSCHCCSRCCCCYRCFFFWSLMHASVGVHSLHSTVTAACLFWHCKFLSLLHIWRQFSGAGAVVMLYCRYCCLVFFFVFFLIGYVVDMEVPVVVTHIFLAYLKWWKILIWRLLLSQKTLSQQQCLWPNVDVPRLFLLLICSSARMRLYVFVQRKLHLSWLSPIHHNSIGVARTLVEGSSLGKGVI